MLAVKVPEPGISLDNEETHSKQQHCVWIKIFWRPGAQNEHLALSEEETRLGRRLAPLLPPPPGRGCLMDSCPQTRIEAAWLITGGKFPSPADHRTRMIPDNFMSSFYQVWCWFDSNASLTKSHLLSDQKKSKPKCFGKWWKNVNILLPSWRLKLQEEPGLGWECVG